METLHIETVMELDAVARTVLEKLVSVKQGGHTPVLAISGDVGAGKTTFMQAFAKLLGVDESVISPTYVIMKRYDASADAPFELLVHLDVYRIDDSAEMEPLHFEEVLKEEGSVVCIEWAEKIQELLPAHTLFMTITTTGENSRDITFSHYA